MTAKNETWKKLAMRRGDYCEYLQAENGRLRSTLEYARDALIGIQNGRYDVRQCGFVARLLESSGRVNLTAKQRKGNGNGFEQCNPQGI